MAALIDATTMGGLARQALHERNRVSQLFFSLEADRIADLSRQLAERFEAGGRLLSIGRGSFATDAQHVEVEFIHPVIVGKRALPAIDVSGQPGALVPLLRPHDVVMGFGPPEGDNAIAEALAASRDHDALTVAFFPCNADFVLVTPSLDPFIHQEVGEIAYHTLWETVHVFLERRGNEQSAGAAGFLYPFLEAPRGGDDEEILRDVASSIHAKAAEVERLRGLMAEDVETIAQIASAMLGRLQTGGMLLMFGNGGSATDANDWAIDCVSSPKGHPPLRALSLAASAANLSALANDLGAEAMFKRQLIACGTREDVAIAISTSGGSANILAALTEARRRGMLTIALLGGSGGEVRRRGLADHLIAVPSDYVPRVQEVHASLYHVIVDLLAATTQSGGF